MHSKRAIIAAFAANISIFVLKFIIALISHSAVIFSESLHTLADSVNSIFLILGFYLSIRPADEEHPFGYGMETYFWTFLASIFTLGVTSMGSIYRGIIQLIHPVRIENLDISFIVLGVVLLIETGAAFVASQAVMTDSGERPKGISSMVFAWRALKKVTNPSVKFVFFEDSFAVAGVLLAIISLVIVKLTGNILADGLTSILIGVLLGFLAITLGLENRNAILGMPAFEPVEEEIGDVAMSVPDVEDVHDIKTLHVGPRAIIVNMEIEVDPDIEIEEADDIAAEVERRIKEAIPEVTHVSIELLADDELQTWD